MHLIDWLLVFLLNGAVIGYGFYLSRGTSTSSDWFLGKRILPWWAIGLSMFATNVDNADIVSVTGKTFNDGLHILTVYAIGSALGGILAAFQIAPAMYRAGLYTNAEYLEVRFGLALRILSALIQIQYRSSMLGLMMWSVFLLLTALGIMGPVGAWCLIVALVLFAGIYTAWGGLKSVVWTDVLQSLVMMAGALAISVSVWTAVGGWTGMTDALERLSDRTGKPYADLPHIGQYDGGNLQTSPYRVAIGSQEYNLGPYVVVLGWTIIGCGYWTVNHTQIMRLMGARSLWDMKLAALAGVAFSLPIMIGVACLGVFGRALPEFEGLTSPDQLYPRLARTHLGVGMTGLVVAGVVAAAISTFDSMGSALSAIFTRDIYARLAVPGREDHHYVTVTRCATVGVLLLGFAYLPFIVLQRNMLDAFTTLIPVFVTPLFTVYVLGVLTSVHRRSGLPALLVGSAYGLLALYAREAEKVGLPSFHALPPWLTDRWGALIWSFLITAGVMILTTLLLGTSPHSSLERMNGSGGEGKGEMGGWLRSSREELPAMKEHPFPDGIPWYSQPSLYAGLLVLATLYVVFGLFW